MASQKKMGDEDVEGRHAEGKVNESQEIRRNHQRAMPAYGPPDHQIAWAQIVMLPRVVSQLQVREGGDRQTKLPTSALQNLPRAKMVVDRVDSGPSALCNATRILSATEDASA